MLPIYNAISFQDVIKKGGRTEPWIVLVNKGNIPTPYVVKLFTPVQIQRYESVANEVIGSKLAEYFGLPVPAPALIDIDDIRPELAMRPELYEILETRDDRITFGCELIKNTNLLDISAFKRYQVKRYFQIDSVFAFDILIRNRDRNVFKPNLLTTSPSLGYLIDHELGFEINGGTADDMLRAKKIPNNVYENHLFLSYLRAGRKSSKTYYFDEFGENLRYLNVTSLKPYLNQLNRLGYSTAKHNTILDYLEKIKANHTTFVNFLKGIP